MRKRGIVILSSVLSIIICISLVLGFTLAVITDTTKISIGLQSGSIKMDAFMTNINLYSAKKYTGNTQQPSEIITDNDGEQYYFEKCTTNFINGGTAEIKEKLLVLKNLCPGDRVDFDLEFKNVGNIAIQYNAIISLVEQMENILFNAMDIRMIFGDEEVILQPFRTGTSSLRTEWLSLALEEEAKIHVSFSLPITADNLYQGIETKFKCAVSAIQDLGDNNSLANLFDAEGNPVLKDGKPIIVTSLKEAIDATPNGGVVDIIRGSEGTENQNILIEKSIALQSSDQELKNFSNVHFEVARGGALQMSNICLKGDSYIDISTANSLVLNHCVFDATPSRLFDESTREFLEFGACIVSRGVQQSGIQLLCNDSNFCSSEDSVAIYMLSTLSTNSKIENTIFGNSTFAYGTSPIYLSGVVGVGEDKVQFDVLSNKFHLQNTTSAITLKKNNGSVYYIKSYHNALVNGSQMIKMEESFPVIVYDKGSSLQGEAITLQGLGALDTTLFTAIQSSMNEDDKFTSGIFKLNPSLSKEVFKSAFVYKLALEQDIIFVED